MRSIERSSDIDFLGKQRCIRYIRCSMNLIQTIQTRDSYLLHGLVLKLFDHLSRHFTSLRFHTQDIQNRTHFVFPYHRIQHGFLPLKITLFILILNSSDGDLCHLTHFLFQSHGRKKMVNLFFYFSIYRNGRSHLIGTG